MTEERRYRDDEISEIFSLASSPDRATGSSLPSPIDREGLTLGELQDVGAEVGLSPERVAAAASALDARADLLPRRSWFGFPVSAGRVVELPRAASDREWQVLVAELRETFRAQGRVASHGDTREWTNGNLHAFLEPTATGHRLRLGTQKGGSKELTIAGAAGLALGLVLLVTSGLDAATFGTTFETLVPVMFALGGGGVMAGNFLRLRRWAATRERQMEHIAGRALALLKGSAPEVSQEA